MTEQVSCWLSFSITPVQGFIEAARTVRDLAVGSRLLSIMVGEAIQAGIRAGGTLLFPAQQGVDRSSLPNQYVMTFKTKSEADVAAKLAVDSALRVWEDLEKNVRQRLISKWGTDWDADWQDQIHFYWDIRVVVISPQDASEANYQRLFGSEQTNPFRRMWHVLAASLNATKQVRKFPGDHGVGRQKCSLIGELEQMGPTGSPSALSKWWEQRQQTRIGVARIGERDRLCAVSLVKRFAPAVSKHRELKDWASSVKDTAEIATAQWQQVVSERLGEDWSAFKRSCDELNVAITSEASEANGGESYARFLLEESLDRTYLEKEYGALAGADIEVLLETVHSRRKQLIYRARNLEFGADQSVTDEMQTKSQRTYKLGPPPRYLAAIALDGDKMGERLNKGDSDQFFQRMSGSLLDFAVNSEQIVQRLHGQHIYAGGDDLLSLIHLEKCLTCVSELNSVFPRNLPGNSAEATASTGVVFFHYKHDLRDALHQTRIAEQEAKRDGRNCVGLRILKRSGGDIQLTSHYDDIQRIEQLADIFRGGASFRWLGNVQELASTLEQAQENQLITQLQYFIRSSEASSDKERERVEKSVLELLTRCFSAYANPIPEVPFQRFIKFMGVAAFMARGRD